MSEDLFSKLAPFIQDYIYRNRWQEMRSVQVAACDVIFNTNKNLLLSSGTASGKTEAAFLPALTEIYNEPSKSVGILYISPLKALINDQFARLYDLLEESHIPVYKWHGDVGRNIKNKVLKKPSGVIQITPESLESMLMYRKGDIIKLFSDLRFIIIDEVHYFMNSQRGIQLLCILERIHRLIGYVPRRIGLSATLGNYSCAENWLNSGTGNVCITPKVTGTTRKLKIRVELFNFIKDNKNNLIGNEPYIDYLYNITKNKKCIIFSNSRAEAENNISALKEYAAFKNTKDVYMVHHGNVATSLREYTENVMKSSDIPIVVGSTVTLELGIDLGDLERIVQTDAPTTVSSFVQRLGRSGRRGNASEMLFAFKCIEENKESFESINWEYLKCIAIIQLYLEERWIEPIAVDKLPFSILYHQTMSIMVSIGEISPAGLAQRVLTLTPFKAVSKEDYKIFLRHLVSINHMELTDDNKLIIGLEGEKIVNNYNFYSVFETPKEYSVRCDGFEIGTVQTKIPKDEIFALAGRTWQVIGVDDDSDCIYVSELKGRSTNNWNSVGGYDVRTKLMKMIKNILISNEEYVYLSENAKLQLKEYRYEANNIGLTYKSIIKLSDNTYGIFPWLGTKALFALHYYFDENGIQNEIRYSGSLPLCLYVKDVTSVDRIEKLYEQIKDRNIDKYSFDVKNDVNTGGKFDSFVAPVLLEKEFIEDFIDVEELKNIDSLSNGVVL